MSEDNRFKHDITLTLETRLEWVLRCGPFDMSLEAHDRGYSQEGRYLGSAYLFQTGFYVLNEPNRIFLWPSNPEEKRSIKCSFEDARWLIDYMASIYFPDEENMLKDIEEEIDFEKNYDIWSSTPDHSRDMEIA